MGNFIKNGLVNARNKNMKTFDYHRECNDGDVVSMKGTVENDAADLEITRTKANGHRCSSVLVQGMPLTDEWISKIVEIAAESL